MNKNQRNTRSFCPTGCSRISLTRGFIVLFSTMTLLLTGCGTKGPLVHRIPPADLKPIPDKTKQIPADEQSTIEPEAIPPVEGVQ